MKHTFTQIQVVIRQICLGLLISTILSSTEAWSQKKGPDKNLFQGLYKLTKKLVKAKPSKEQVKNAGFNFKSSLLKGDRNGRLDITAGLKNPTSLQFGPDGRLYVAQQNGLIKVLTIVKNGPNDYAIASQETISLINTIPNHNDDGSLAPAVTTRQVTGLLVSGTASSPILYVSSSDSRIGGPEGDLNLDTNSGIVSKLTKTTTGWVKVDLVRGLPRSEENHATNGLQLDGTRLYLVVGGHTNAGSPSTNFAYTPEYALAACVLSIDLAVIEALPTRGSGNTAYKYDLPTLDDPDRPGNPDANDPFGGNDGLNQAKIVPGGPVQVFASGFRNAYDLVITRSRKMYVTDNGANPGWGGHPASEGVGTATNNYVAGEPGSTGPGPNDPKVNNLDNFHYVGDLRSYVSGSYYGGHPHPIRANPAGAGLYTHNGTSGVWRTSTSGANPLPSDWPPVPLSMAHPIEGDFQNPGETNSALLTFVASTNGITEYTASGFNNGLKGNLLVASFDGTIQKITLNEAGTDVTNSRGAKKKNLDLPFASNFGSQPLDITAQGDNDIFPGTVWVVCYLQNQIYVFEPEGGGGNCSAAYSTAFDDDGDGYSNADEIDNGSNPCSISSRPSDADGDKLSDLNDPDDDNDGLNDDVDYFALDASNGTNTNLPIDYELFNNDPGTGLFGLGFTGLMLPNQTGINYLDLFDEDNLIAGGAVGAFSVVNTTPGDAHQALNNQENGFQFGINTDKNTGPFTVQTRLLGPFFNNQTPKYWQALGQYIGIGDQDNYLKIVMGADGGTGGIEVLYENNGVENSTRYSLPGGLPGSTMDLYLSVNPATGMVQPKYAKDGGTITNLGLPIQVGGKLLEAIQGPPALAVGLISTSLASTPFTATWDRIRVTKDNAGNTAPALSAITNQTAIIGQALTLTAQASDSDVPAQTLTYSVSGPAGTSINASTGAFSWTPTTTGTFSLTIKATDSGSPALSAQRVFSVLVNPAASAGIRVNAGGPAYSASGNRPFGADAHFTGGSTSNAGNVPIDNTVDDALYQTERYGNFSYNVPVSNGYYNVILHFAETFGKVIDGTASRKFHVDVEGVRRLTEYDIAQKAGGTLKAVQETLGVNVTDGTLTVVFSAGSAQNPKVNAIEVVAATAPPNQSPVVASALPDQNATLGRDFSFTFSATAFSDPNGDPLTYTATLGDNSALPAWLSFNASTRTFSGKPTSAGNLTVKVTARDGQGGSVSDSFVINTSAPANTAPVLAAIGNKTANIGQALTLTAQASDSDAPAQTLTYSVSGPAGASINASTGAFSWTPTTTGTFSLTIKATDSGSPALSAQRVFSVLVNPAITPGVRINAGGPAFQMADGRPFGADANFTGGGTSNAGNVPIDNTVDDALYQTERYGNFSYNVPVSNGYYNVILHFAETFGKVIDGTASRKFHVDVEGVRRLTEYDIAQKAGGTLKAVQETLGVNVTDGTLTVVFSAGSAQNPKVNAIEVVAATAPPNRAPVQTKRLPDQRATEWSTFSYVIDENTFRDPNEDPLTYTATLWDNSALPAWLSFDGATRRFRGMPPSNSPLSLIIRVTASDGRGGSVSDRFLMLITRATGTGSWRAVTPRTGKPTARLENGYVQAGDRFYLIGGRGIKPVQVYDPVARSWTNAAAPPIDMHHFQAVTLEGLVYVAGALTGTYPAEPSVPRIYIYDPKGNKWLEGPEIPSARRRGSAALAVYDNKLYLVGGNTKGHNNGYVAWFDEYNPATNTWRTLPDAPHSRDHFQAVIMGDKLYAAGGRRTSANTGQTFMLTVPEVDVYDFKSGQWTTLSEPIPTPRAGAAAVVLNNELVVIGGESPQPAAHQETEVLNPATGMWRRLANLQQSRHASQAISNNGTLYVVAGSGAQGGTPALSSQEVYARTSPTNPTGRPLTQSQLNAPASVTVGQVTTKTTKGAGVTVTNTSGNQAILLSNISLAGSTEFSFQAPFALPFVIPVGKSVTIPINFTPSSVGSKTATLTVLHSGQGGTASVALNGQGVGNTVSAVAEPSNEARTTAGEPLVELVKTAEGRLSTQNQPDTEPIRVVYFPNPFTDSFTVRVVGKPAGPVSLALYDLSGRRVWQGTDGAAEQVIRLSEELGDGVYSLEVRMGQFVKHYQLVRVR
ncbi:putative Ig domain-containing protein [Larkinella insperata]|nr:putative Ig domain-containing protein [Larkinella insperata]